MIIQEAGNTVVIASTDRHNGVSFPPFHSSNISYSVGDDPLSVADNRKSLKKELSIPYILSATQIHGDMIFPGDTPLYDDVEVEGYDALMTNIPGIGLMIQQADCQAITLFDPTHSAIAAIHNGWKGSVLNITAKTVLAMQEHYGTSPADLLAYISPALGPCCAEFINHTTELPPSFLAFQIKKNYFDFWQISKMQLSASGLHEHNIEIAGQCTSCSANYFSYRRARRNGNGQTGRCATVICLR
ncbi:hypothetical protein UWK_01172 [Desulfocapsa sulfexigens DSM 10523]|uniref:Purine nucleoside phosphorylase n=1 Tax=Desulfocapsa sulfexigens (strain DSM 10523 / SB164P1) TaxID=1167006 RepID=M1PDB3_DESSD|nr:polyphenol oxidase family protein [Desulfocapsa sulfexigens]AGF77740.1 hypothetical protein UWK_01172 [Desulfocapsa sulfexigens DSM 10523]